MLIEPIFSLVLIAFASFYAYMYARHKRPLDAAFTVLCGLTALL